MKKLAFLVLIALCCGVAMAASDDDDNTFRATLRGINETPGPVATQATGSFTATLSSDGSTLSYTVKYANLNAQVTQSHIHFGLTKHMAGIMVCLFHPPPPPPPPTLAFPPARAPPPEQYPAQLQRPM